MQGKVWLIGGTSDSVEIAQILTTACINLVITVATSAASALYTPESQVIVGRLNLDRMQSFCRQHQVVAVVDASHPYAAEVSRMAIAATTQLNIPYLRYERQVYQSASKARTPTTIIELDSFDTLLAGNYLSDRRVLLTIGCKALPLFQPWQSQAVLFARILPKLASLQTALDSGFTSDRLIAIRPPLSFDWEKALWQQWQISTVVTKASGKAGGEDIKRQLAAELNISLIVINRPQIIYPQQTSCLFAVTDFCISLIK